MRKSLVGILGSAILIGLSVLPLRSEEITSRVYKTETQYNTASQPYQGAPEQKLAEEETFRNGNRRDPKYTEKTKRLEEALETEGNKTSTQVSLKRNMNNQRITLRYTNYGFKNLNQKERERLPLNEQYLSEDPNNTHIYLFIPAGASSRVLTQNITTQTNQGQRTTLGKQTNETKVYELAIEINQKLKEREKSKEQKPQTPISIIRKEIAKHTDGPNNVYEELLDRGINEIDGPTGLVVQLTKEGMKLTITKAEEKRRARILKDINQEGTLIKIPFYQLESNPFNPITGRTVTIGIDRTRFDGEKEAYIVIPKMSFRSSSTRTNTSTQLRDIKFDIPIQGIKSRIKGLEQISGEWKPILDPRKKRLIIKPDTYEEKTPQIQLVDEVTQIQPGFFRLHTRDSRFYSLVFLENPKVLHFLGSRYSKDIETDVGIPGLKETLRRISSEHNRKTNPKIPQELRKRKYQLLQRKN